MSEPDANAAAGGRSVQYDLDLRERSRRRVLVRATFTASEPLPEPFEVALPVWSPGSYLVREYSRHVEALRASVDGAPVGVRKVRKNAWAIAHGGARSVEVTYAVYAHELGVRASHVDGEHAWLHGPTLYVFPLRDPGWSRAAARVSLPFPDPAWRVTTALAPEGAGFRAEDYDDLLDAPIDAGPHPTHRFDAAGRPHALSIYGAELADALDAPRLVAAMQRIIEHEAAFFGALPAPRYACTLLLAPGQRGGLEHRNGCALIHDPEVFATEEGWLDLLALFAHEYLHLWHVRRVRPAGLVPIDYERENHTRALWLFEGATSYYDWLFLRRAGVVDAPRYLKHLGAELTRLAATPGRLACSLEDASFDAWIRHYRPDEESPNRSVSYYLKGALVAWLLDLTIRDRSGGERSLDDVMRWLWAERGATGEPLAESGFEAAVAAATGVDVSDRVEAWVRGLGELPVAEVVAAAGLALVERGGRGASLGARLRSDGARAVVASVERGGAAERAGVAPGDELVALGARRVTDPETARNALRRMAAGEVVPLIVARRGRVLGVEATLDPAPPEGVELRVDPEASPDARRLARQWMGDDVTSLWRTEP